MRSRRYWCTGVAALTLIVTTAAMALDVPGVGSCSDASLHGVYGIQLSGTRPSSPGGPPEAVIGVVVRFYDGRGGVVQIDNVKGAISGYTPDRLGVGTYHVNPDCSVVIDFTPGPGQQLEERAVLVDNGHELR